MGSRGISHVLTFRFSHVLAGPDEEANVPKLHFFNIYEVCHIVLLERGKFYPAIGAVVRK